MSEIDDANGTVNTGLRGAKIQKRWHPKEWRPEYTAIVALSCTGLSNEAVGKHFGYGKQQISNILNQPEAKEIRKLIGNEVLETSKLTLPERIGRLQEKAFSRIEDLINNEDRAASNPLQIFDRSFKFLQATSVLKDDGPNASRGGNTTNIQNNSTLVISDALAARLSEGLHRAKQVAELHQVEAISIEPKKLTG